ncbi:YdeI/OmpD-associated family protein [Hymenobacter coalescens]
MEALLLIDCQVTLEKFAGKGGWTYAPLPPLPPGGGHFGTRPVTGRIDEHPLAACHLMPMGQGRLFLPINAALRKRLAKQAGDTVRLVLYDASPAAGIAEADFEECLAEQPAALRHYRQLLPAQRLSWRQWVAAAPTEAAQVARAERALVLLAHSPALPPA